MPNYNQPHQFYAGVDLHARTSLSRCGTRPTPPTVGLAPRPVTEESTIEPKGVRRRLHPHRWGNDEKTVAARRPSED